CAATFHLRAVARASADSYDGLTPASPAMSKMLFGPRPLISCRFPSRVRLRKLPWTCGVIVVLFGAATQQACASTATTTTLVVTSGGNAMTTVAAGRVV